MEENKELNTEVEAKKETKVKKPATTKKTTGTKKAATAKKETKVEKVETEEEVVAEKEVATEKETEVKEEVKTKSVEELISNTTGEIENPIEAEKEVEPTVVAESVSEETTEPAKADDITGTYTGSNQQLDNSYFAPIKFIKDDSKSIDETFDQARDVFNKKLNKSRVIDVVGIIMMLAGFAAVLLVTFLNKGTELQWLTWVIISISFVLIITSFILTSIFNRKNAKLTKDYLNQYEDILNGYAISDLNVVNPTLCVDAKVNDQDVIQAHYFRTINRIESRAVVEGKRCGYPFSLAEVVVVIPTISIASANKKPEDYVNLDGSTYIPAPSIEGTLDGTIDPNGNTNIDITLSDEVNNSKQAEQRAKDQKKAASANKVVDTATGLFGKIYSYGYTVSSEEAFIITIMGDPEATVLPDYLTGFKACMVDGLKKNIVIYAVDPSKLTPFLDEEGVKLLNSIDVNTAVQSLFISVNSYGCKVGMNLSDDIMQLPIKQLGSIGAYDAYKDATDAAFNFIDYVAKKRK